MKTFDNSSWFMAHVAFSFYCHPLHTFGVVSIMNARVQYLIVRLIVLVIFLLLLYCQILLHSNYKSNHKTKNSPIEFLSDIEFIKIDFADEDSSSNLIPSFAVFENQSELIEGQLKQIETYSIAVLTAPDPRLLSPYEHLSKNMPITTQYFLCSEGKSVFHIALLIPRFNYFWSGPIDRETLKANGCELSSDSLTLVYPLAIDGFLLHHRTILKDKQSRIYQIPTNLPLFHWHMAHSRFQECHYEKVVWPFHRIYGSSGQSNDTNSIRIGLETIRKVSVERKVPLQIVFGTLLGWYRQCGFISYSLDTDFATDHKYMSKKFFRSLWFTKNVWADGRMGIPESGFELQLFARPKGHPIDIFTLYQHGNMTYTYSYDAERFAQYRESFTAETFNESTMVTVEFLGVLAYAPANPLLAITTAFADSWFEPKDSVNYLNIKLAERYSKEDFETEVYHKYELHNCTNPSILRGCDTIESVK